MKQSAFPITHADLEVAHIQSQSLLNFIHQMVNPAELLNRMIKAPIPANKNPKTLHLGFHLYGGIGDLMAGSNVIEFFLRRFPEATFDIYTTNTKGAEFIFRHDQRLKTIYMQEPAFPHTENYLAEYDMVIATGYFILLKPVNFNKMIEIWPDFLEYMGRNHKKVMHDVVPILQPTFFDGWHGNLFVKRGFNRLAAPFSYVDDKPDFTLTDFPFFQRKSFDDDLAARFLGGTRRYITIHDGFDKLHNETLQRATKNWLPAYWEDLLSRVKLNFPHLSIVQLGTKDSNPLNGADINLAGKTSLDETAIILKNSALHIDGESGLVYVAGAVKTPSVVLFGPTNIDFFGFNPDNTHLKAKCGNCWWTVPTWMKQCPRGFAIPECMETLTPEFVYENIKGKLAAIAA